MVRCLGGLRKALTAEYGESKVISMQNNHLTGHPRITDHAKAQAALKGWSLDDVFQAHVDPDICYPSGSHPGQQRHIRNDLVVVVDAKRNTAVTVYLNVKETDLRPDQIARGERKAS